MARRQSTFMRWLHQHYESYLARKRSEGGFCPEWTTAAIRDALADPEMSGWAAAGAEMLARTCQQVWQTDPVPEQLDLFSVGGIEILASYTFADPNTPGGYRRVSGRWATPRHAQGDQFVKQAKATEAVQAADRAGLAVAALFAASAGNPDALLWDLRDQPGQQAA